ncbi:hypothetical protein V5O48_002450 [Marasmius crinis-equi]|uniref:Uncharacterized protein n=1 Tax=Marasmius crinis-equi TaxID=585013 RepID=A0ABR3FW54_9AGAR
MHTWELLKFWGPLVLLNEYPFERYNGKLQDIPHNSHLYELDLTVLQKVCRQGRLAAFAVDTAPEYNPQSDLGRALRVLYDIPLPSDQLPGDPRELRRYCDALTRETYECVLWRLNEGRSSEISFFLDCHAFPFLPGSENRVLFNRVKRMRHVRSGGYEYSERAHGTLGNSTISFLDPMSKQSRTGSITEIFAIALPGCGEQVFLTVSPHLSLADGDEDKNPYCHLPYLACDVVYCQESLERILITPNEITFHVALYKRPRGTFGIDRDIYITQRQASSRAQLLGLRLTTEMPLIWQVGIWPGGWYQCTIPDHQAGASRGGDGCWSGLAANLPGESSASKVGGVIPNTGFEGRYALMLAAHRRERCRPAFEFARCYSISDSDPGVHQQPRKPWMNINESNPPSHLQWNKLNDAIDRNGRGTRLTTIIDTSVGYEAEICLYKVEGCSLRSPRIGDQASQDAITFQWVNILTTLDEPNANVGTRYVNLEKYRFSTALTRAQGTGKSFIGAPLAKILHDHTEQKLLVYCAIRRQIHSPDIAPRSERVQQKLENLRLFGHDWEAIDSSKSDAEADAQTLAGKFEEYVKQIVGLQDVLEYLEFEEPDAPDGGCNEPCGTRLSCGLHDYPFKCHQLTNHSRMKCNVLIKHTCPQGHDQSHKCCQKAPWNCRQREEEAKMARKKQEEALRQQQKREAEQLAHAQELAKIEEQIAQENQRVQDERDRQEREATLMQKKKDLDNMRARYDRMVQEASM